MRERARAYGHKHVDILLALLTLLTPQSAEKEGGWPWKRMKKARSNIALQIVEILVAREGFEVNALRSALWKRLACSVSCLPTEVFWSKRLKQALSSAENKRETLGPKHQLGCDHLLLGLLEHAESDLIELFARFGVTKSAVYAEAVQLHSIATKRKK